jgi:large subunit ribosomal protein L24
MAKARIQTGDTVKIIAGNYRGIVGQILAVVKKKSGKLTKLRASISTVPGIAKYRRSFKYNGQSYPGMMYQVPRLIDVSNLSQLTTEGQLSKVAIKIEENKKVRVLKKTGTVVESVKVVAKPAEVSQLEQANN